MISFPRILFPVDLSKQSLCAAPFVKALAARFHSDITLLHVVEVPPTWSGATGEAAFNAWVDTPGFLETRRAELIEFQQRELADVTVQPCVQSGDAAAIIHRVAHQKQISLIMMPTHGYGPVRSLLLGSVTAKVLHDAECPVWTVMPSHLTEDPQAPNQNLICALDTSPKAVPLLRWAAEFAAQENAHLKLIHVVTGFDVEQCQCAEDPLRDFVFDIARERIEKLQAEAGTHLEATVAAGRTGDAVREWASEDKADLILIGRGVIQKPLGRLRSNAYSIVRDAPCPVISV